VLARFGLSGFAAAQTALPLVVTMLLAATCWASACGHGMRCRARLLVAIIFVAATSGFTGADIDLA
jgi:benzoate membrane transport protein